MAKGKKRKNLSPAQKEERRKEYAELRAKENRKNSIFLFCGIILFLVLIVASVSLLSMGG